MSYENEYRIFVDVEKLNNNYLYGVKIAAIYVGPKISNNNLCKVMKIAKGKIIPVFSGILNNKDFLCCG